jgi:hypothetical protein
MIHSCRIGRGRRRGLFIPTLVCLTAVAWAVPSRALAATPEQVEAALQKAKDNLYSKMQKGQFWEETPAMDEKAGDHTTAGRQWGGLSSIAIYALLASGENHQEEKLKPAIEWIKKQRLVGNYALGLRAQIWQFLPQTPEVRQLALKDRAYFEKGIHTQAVVVSKGDPKKGIPMKKDDSVIGFYPYWFNDDRTKMHPGNGWYDLSVSQYGVLGMWAVDQVDGVEVPADYWRLVDRAWKNAQVKEGPDSGAWAYRKSSNNAEQEKPKATMTAAGVATLFITQDYLLSYASFDNCKGGANNPWIDAGLAWMDKHVTEMLKGNHYGMYGVERIGVASGKKYFGTIDWYDVGADYLVKSQAADGSWGGSIPNTCFSMLFLSRGRAPVIMNKLEYSLNDPKNKAIRLPWDQRPRDVANFARFAGKQSEQFFNWQVVNLKVSPDDLHDAPILYISGSLPLDFGDEEIKKLREFCEAGGMILFNPDCGDKETAFTESVVGPKGIARKMFPKYEFRELPQNHPIFTDEVYLAKNWKSKPKVLGLSNGVREMMLLAPEVDMGRAWQLRAEKTREEAYQLGINIFYYAAERGFIRLRGDSHIVKPDPKIVPAAKVKLARLMVGDNPDPEPNAWKRMSALILNKAKVSVAVESIPLGQGKLVPGPSGYQMAHLTGTTKFKFNPEQEAEIKKFVAGGGTLLIDAAGGSNDFATSAEKALAAIFGGDPTAVGPVLPLDDLPYTWTGFKIPKVDYRKYARTRISGKLTAPRVRGIDVAGKTRVFYSREDLSNGMLGQPADGVIVYAPDSATAIVRNIVLYAAYNGKAPKPPASQPATQPAAAAQPQ